MKTTTSLRASLLALSLAIAVILVSPHRVAAHCDTLDGPVAQDAHKAIAARDVTPVLKWVQPHDEKGVRAAFQQLLAAKGAKAEAAEQRFLATLVRIHRAGEGAPFTGLKPAGTVEPAVAAADQALASGSADALVKLISDDVAAGIKKRHELAAERYRHKDESVARGREFVAAYVDYTHYVERLHRDALLAGGHEEHADHKDHGRVGKKIPSEKGSRHHGH